MNKISKYAVKGIMLAVGVVVLFSGSLKKYEDFDYWPAKNYYEITSPYGERVNPVTGRKSFHSGVDIGVPEGGELVSVIDGVVSNTGFIIGYGYVIIIKGEVEGEEYTLIYAHASPEYLVYEGLKVFKGDIIGYSGPKFVKINGKVITNGYTTGPHLHFEVRKNGSLQDPIAFLEYLEILSLKTDEENTHNTDWNCWNLHKSCIYL